MDIKEYISNIIARGSKNVKIEHNLWAHTTLHIISAFTPGHLMAGDEAFDIKHWFYIQT